MDVEAASVGLCIACWYGMFTWWCLEYCAPLLADGGVTCLTVQLPTLAVGER